MQDSAGNEPEAAGVKARSSKRGWLVMAVVLIATSVIIGTFWVWASSRFASESEVQIADVSSERLLGHGSVVGFAAEHDTHAWLGIPFARPPVGALRWRAPQAPDAWADTLDALEAGAPCPQLASKLGGVASAEPGEFVGEEDCLRLNVWSPRSDPEGVPRAGDRLPVMVWIHGGGNTVGDGGSSMYDGARLAGTQKVVVVTINYRLGPFGWFSHPALREAASTREEASGNFGNLDQIFALEWVRDNIEEFGGDPGNVTIFGESAGATDIFALLLAKPAAGLFHRAIAQSGSTDSVSREEAENESDGDVPGHYSSSAEVVVRLLAEDGIVPDLAAARRYADELPNSDLLEFLRSRSASEIMDVVRKPGREDIIDVPRLIRDGTVLPEGDWIAAFRAGRFNAVPTLLGSNRDEMKLFHSQNEKYVRKRFRFLYTIRDPEDFERRARYGSDLWKVRAVDRPAAAISDSGRASVFAYRFDWDEEPRLLGTDLAQLLGASHGFEIPFVFGNFDIGDPLMNAVVFDSETRPSREILAERMIGYWTEFARTGRPGKGGREDSAEWVSWSPDGENESEAESLDVARMMILDTESDGGIRVSATRMTRDHVIAAVDSDSALGHDERCALFRDLFSSRPDWSVEKYRGIGSSGCAGYPFDKPGP